MTSPYVKELNRLNLPGGPVNEDRAGTGRFETCACAWVIDGATGIAGREFIAEGPTDAAWLAEQLHRGFAVHDPSRLTASTYFHGLIEAIATAYHAKVPQAHALPPYALPSAAAMWVRVSEAGLTFAWHGDCIAIIDDGSSVAVLGSTENPPWEAGINEIVQQTVRSPPTPIGSMVQALSAPLRDRRARLNQPDGYWMLGVDPRAARHINQHQIKVSRPARILLASDGLWRLVDHFHIYDPNALLEAATAEGLAALGRRLRHLEDDDRECRRVPRVKPYDDATGLLLEIGF